MRRQKIPAAAGSSDPAAAGPFIPGLCLHMKSRRLFRRMVTLFFCQLMPCSRLFSTASPSLSAPPSIRYSSRLTAYPRYRQAA